MMSFKDSDISEHLPDLYLYAVNLPSPKLFVELGVRYGASTRVLLAAAEDVGAHLLSLDIANASHLFDSEHWSFIQADSTTYAPHGFQLFCQEHLLEPEPDLIFLDTSHEFADTCKEVKSWMPLLKKGGMFMFHDTNLDWGDGVNKGIEATLNYKIRGPQPMISRDDHYIIRHVPNCNGFTVIQKR